MLLNVHRQNFSETRYIFSIFMSMPTSVGLFISGLCGLLFIIIFIFININLIISLKQMHLVFLNIPYLGGDYMIPVSRDEILSHFAGIPAMF